MYFICNKKCISQKGHGTLHSEEILVRSEETHYHSPPFNTADMSRQIKEHYLYKSFAGSFKKCQNIINPQIFAGEINRNQMN
jgi:hypothetical protein